MPIGESCPEMDRIDENEKEDDICGICGEPGADKMATWTGCGIYWPGEFKPETEFVHQSCEQEESQRAHAALSPEEREQFLRRLF